MSEIKIIATGNLFQLAAQYLGDASQWIQIAKLNNLADPFLNGPTMLTVPTSAKSKASTFVS